MINQPRPGVPESVAGCTAARGPTPGGETLPASISCIRSDVTGGG